MRVGLVQYAPVWEDKQASKDKIQILCRAHKNKLDLLLFPELTLTGFTMRSRKYAEALPGESSEWFAQLASFLASGIIFGIIELHQGAYYNTLVHIDKKGEIVSAYRKIHPFSYTGENRFYASGISPAITEIDGYKFGLTVCYDLRFPELFRYYGKERCHGILNIANWPVQRIAHWNTLLQARAIENICYILAVNRVGKDKTNTYNGASSVYSPFGERICYRENEAGILTCAIDLSRVDVMRNEFPFLDDIKLI